jgi:hypothetical protein
MTTIPHLNTDCQEDIYIDGAGIVRRHSASQPVDPPLTPLWEAAQNGKVETDNAWDGWELSDIYTELMRDGEDMSTAAAIVDDIMYDRLRALNGKGRDKLDAVQAQVETEEPAAFELEISYIEDEVIA